KRQPPPRAGVAVCVSAMRRRGGCIAPGQLNPADSMRLVGAFLLLAGDRVLRVVRGGAHGLLRLRPLRLARGRVDGVALRAPLLLGWVEVRAGALLAALGAGGVGRLVGLARRLGVVVRRVAVWIARVALLRLHLLGRGRAGRLRLLALLLLH